MAVIKSIKFKSIGEQLKSKEKQSNIIFFVYKQSYWIQNIVSLSQSNNKKLYHTKRKKKSLIQKDRVNFQKFHQIARMVNPNDRATKYTIPWIIKWLKTMELMEKMKQLLNEIFFRLYCVSSSIFDLISSKFVILIKVFN